MDLLYYTIRVVAILWLSMLLFIFAIGGNAFNKPNKADRSSRYFILATLSTVLPVIQYAGGVAQSELGGISWGYPFVSYVGIFLIVLGVVIHWIGIQTLQKQWSLVVEVSKNHTLVDTGIYHFIRHPIYAALLLELLGFGVALANWVAIVLLVVPNAASFAYRIFVEEQALENHFGDAYLSYERRTKRLLPGLF